MKTLFVRNLPFNASEAELRKAFEAFGPVHRCSIAKNRDTGESRGFGFVDMEDDAAGKAIAEMNGRMFANRTIVVQESDPKSRGGVGGGAPSGQGRPPMGGARPSGGFGQGAPSRPHSPGGPARSDGGMSRAASYPSRPSQPLNRNFGPPASPASERNRVYKDKKDDRLKPYKRDQFDFRSALEEDEEEAKKKRKDDEDGGGGGE